MKRVCVYCGSSPGADPAYLETARTVGHVLAQHQIELVYGGGNVGLMGAVADAVLGDGGKVVGIIPDFLVRKEVAHRRLTEQRVVKSMHERKLLMAEMSDAFIALPGGLGTFEELFEILTWGQLGLHRKPCSLMNVNGYFDHLIQFIEKAVEQRFVTRKHFQMLHIATSIEDILEHFESYEAPVETKWLDRDKI